MAELPNLITLIGSANRKVELVLARESDESGAAKLVAIPALLSQERFLLTHVPTVCVLGS